MKNKNEEFLNRFDFVASKSNCEKEDEYYKMFISRYGYDPRLSGDHQ